MNKKDNVKEKLLQASIRLFVTKGYAGGTTNEIARSAGVSKGALYWYFKSKDDIVSAILDRYCDEFMEGITKRVNGCSGDFITKFKIFYKFTAEFARDNGELLLVFIALLTEFANTGTELEKRMKEINDNYILIIQKLLEGGIRDTTVGKEIDPAFYAQFFAGTLMGSFFQYLLHAPEYNNDPAYPRRLYTMERDALLKVVLRGRSQ
jgi:AcrR family transcriptional regulator